MIEIIRGIEVDVQKKPVKHVRIKITRDGKVILNIPSSISKKSGIDFFLQKIDWVKNKLNGRKINSPLSLKDGEEFYLFGSPVCLKIEKGVKSGFLIVNNSFILYVTDTAEEKVKKAFENALKEILFDRAVKYFDKWQNLSGLCRSSLTIRKTVSRWGSCNPKTGAINLSLYLINLPEFCLDYVVLHELCHLRYSNHGKLFKLFLSGFMKNWTDIDKFLKVNGNAFKMNIK